LNEDGLKVEVAQCGALSLFIFAVWSFYDPSDPSQPTQSLQRIKTNSALMQRNSAISDAPHSALPPRV
jgi:hypothetical protein